MLAPRHTHIFLSHPYNPRFFWFKDFSLERRILSSADKAMALNTWPFQKLGHVPSSCYRGAITWLLYNIGREENRGNLKKSSGTSLDTAMISSKR